MKVITMLLLCCTTFAAGNVEYQPVRYMKAVVIEQVRECTREQVEMCGDSICEGDEETESVIQATGDAIVICLERRLQ